MKRICLAIFMFIAVSFQLLFWSPLSVYAQRPADETPAASCPPEQPTCFSTSDKPINPCDSAPDSPICKDYNNSIGGNKNPIFGPTGILTIVARIFTVLTGIVSVFMVIIGGLKYVTSSGEASKTASAKDTIMYAAIGLVVAISAGAIVQFVLTKL